MLNRLSVENYALIDRLDIELAAGLNIVTGETGAGKSILLGALGLILGNRTDAAAIKNSQRNCVIEAEFDIDGYGLEALFESLDIDYENRTIIRRIVTPGGKSRAYVNDIPVQMNTLREIGSRLIDIHSQHQTLLLADNRFQTGIVDSVASHDGLLSRYKETFAALQQSERELNRLRQQAEANDRDREYLAFQSDELQKAKLKEGEQAELEAQQTELSHAAEIKDTLLWISQEMTGADENLLGRIKEIEVSLGRIARVYPQADAFYSRLHSAALDLKDMASEIASEGDRLEADPQRLESVSQRLDLIYSLQQKHKADSVEALLALQTDYEKRLAQIEGSAQAVETLSQRIGELRAKAAKQAAEITAGRKKTAPHVEKQVKEMLAELGMPAAELRIEITPAAELRPDGADDIRFLFTANRHMPPQPIERVASGGEMSRLMLSLKAIVAHHSQLPTVIFDEIDTGVSGSIADRMGEIISRLSEDLQVVNITHLPQIASKGDHHFFVYKEESGATTATRIRKLDQQQRIDEIAKMLSGTDVTAAAREQARLLLNIRPKQ